MGNRIKVYDRLPGRGHAGPLARTGPFDSGMRAQLQPGGYSPLKHPSCRCWYEADHTDFMGRVVDRTVDPYAITTIPNFLGPLGIDGGTFDEAGARRPAYASIEAGGIRREVATFNRTSVHYHDSSLATSFWLFYQQNFSLFLAFRPIENVNGEIVSTRNVLHGAGCRYIAGGSVNWGCYNSVGGSFTSTAGTPGTTPLNEVSIYEVHFDYAAGAPEGYSYVNGIFDVNSVALVGVVDPVNPDGTLRIGAKASGGGFPASVNVMAVLLYNQRLTLAERVEPYEYLRDKYQNNSVAVGQAPVFWFRLGVAAAFEVDEANATAGEQPQNLWDLGGNAHRAYQTTDANQGDLRRVDELFDGQASVEADGATTNYVVSPGIGWALHPGTNHSCIVVIDQRVATGNSDYLIDAQTGRLVFAPLTTTAGQIGCYDGGAWRDLGAAILGPQVYEWHLDDTGNLVSGYRHGVLTGTAVYGAATALGGTVRLFSIWSSGGQYFPGRDAELWHRDSLLTGVDLWEYREELYELYRAAWGQVPGGEAWWNPLVESHVTVDGAGRVSAVQDSNERGNTETQAVPADQPLLVTAADGYLALRFDGNNEYVDTGVVANAGAGAVWGWFRMDNVAGSLVAIGAIDGTPDRCFLYKQNASGQWQFAIGASLFSSGVTVTPGTWYFVVGTWDGTNETIYVNGVWVTQAAGEIPATNTIYIGARNNTGADDLHWPGDIGEHGVFPHALDPYDVAILRRQTQRGGTRETWTPLLLPGHVAWCVPKWGEVVTRSGASRISQIADGHATVASGAQNNSTQAIPGNQPLWVASGGAGDGVPAARFASGFTEFVDTNVIPSPTTGTIWCLVYMTGAGNYHILSSLSAGPLRCGLLRVAGNLYVHIGTVTTDTGFAFSLNAWHLIGLSWDAAGNYIGYIDGNSVTAAVVGAISVASLYLGCRNNIGVPDFAMNGDISEYGIADEQFTVAQFDRLYEKVTRSL